VNVFLEQLVTWFFGVNAAFSPGSIHAAIPAQQSLPASLAFQ
jgi:hypothetical protein